MTTAMVTTAASAIVMVARNPRVESGISNKGIAQNPAIVRVSTAAPSADACQALLPLTKQLIAEQTQAQLDRLLDMAIVEDREP